MLPDVNQIWNWVVKRFKPIQNWTSINREPYSIAKSSTSQKLDVFLQGNDTSVKKDALEDLWEHLLQNGTVHQSIGWTSTPACDGSAAKFHSAMYAFGEGSSDGLVYGTIDKQLFSEGNYRYFLRYIPVDFNLFDSIMAELNLRRSKSNTEDDTLATYEPSDWIDEAPTGTWRVHVKKNDTTGYNISIENNGTTTINLTQDETVKQFAEYDWSIRNANTIKGETPRFYVSWPEKMLLQKFLQRQLEDINVLKYDPKTPEIWWHIIVKDEENIPYDHPSIPNHGLIGLQFNISKRNWSNIPINQSSTSAQIEDICTTKTDRNQIYPFIYLIRPGDTCIRTPKQKLCISHFSSKVPTYKDHIKSTGIVRLTTAWNQLKQIREEKGKIQKIVVKHPLGEVKINAQATTLMVLKEKKDGDTREFTQGFSTTKKYPSIIYKDFIEQRAKVLDPTSRALLVYLKNNTGKPIDTDLDGDNVEMETPNTEPTKLIRPADKIPSSELSQKLLLSKNLILEGVPGTGKTFGFKNSIVEGWKQEVGREVGSKDEAITMHPSTSYEDFLEGLRPTAIQPKKQSIEQNDLQIDQIHLQETKDSTPIIVNDGYFYHRVGSKSDEDSPASNFTVADGFFLNVCKQAVQNPTKDYLVLLDEINRCNIPSVFGDLLTAIERSKRATWDNDKQCWDLLKAQTITLAISKRKFFVPENVYVVGTMNTTDRSVAPMDMALRRRFAFHRIEPTPLNTEDLKVNDIESTYLKESNECLDGLNKLLKNSHGHDALLGFSYLYDMRDDLQRYSDSIEICLHHWNHHILPQLSDIIFSNQTTDDDLEKVLKTLSSLNSNVTLHINSIPLENWKEDTLRNSERLQLELK